MEVEYPSRLERSGSISFMAQLTHRPTVSQSIRIYSDTALLERQAAIALTVGIVASHRVRNTNTNYNKGEATDMIVGT